MSRWRRLRHLEEALSVRGVVGLWLAGVQQHATNDAYLGPALRAPAGAAPLDKLLADVEAAVHTAYPWQTRQEIAPALRRAREDTIYLYQLALWINETAAQEADRAGIQALHLAWEARMLQDDPGRSEPWDPAADPPPIDVLGGHWRAWSDVVAVVLDRVRVEEAARARLEQWYFDGHSVLFPDQTGAWAALRAQLAWLEELLEALPASRVARSSSPSPLPSAPVAERIEARAVELAEETRVFVLEWLGESDEAREALGRLWWATDHPSSTPPPSDAHEGPATRPGGRPHRSSWRRRVSPHTVTAPARGRSSPQAGPPVEGP